MGIAKLYLFVLFSLSTPLALFECWGITHFRIAWGQPLPQDTFWGKQIVVKVPWNAVDVRLATRYHAFTFLVLFPVLLTTASLFFKRWVANPPQGWPAWTLFIVACVAGNMVLEDFLYFVFSTIFGKPYPHAVSRLLRGEANWHPRHLDLGYFKLPDFYVYLPFAIAILLVAVWWLSR
jgi:hypothetical protein